jgi:hypothetical protein
MAHDFVSGHETIRIIPVVMAAGQLHGPVGNDQAETVPAPAPRIGDLAALEDDVFDPCLRKLVAQGEPGLAGTHQDDVNGFRHGCTW